VARSAGVPWRGTYRSTHAYTVWCLESGLGANFHRRSTAHTSPDCIRTCTTILLLGVTPSLTALEAGFSLAAGPPAVHFKFYQHMFLLWLGNRDHISCCCHPWIFHAFLLVVLHPGAPGLLHPCAPVPFPPVLQRSRLHWLQAEDKNITLFAALRLTKRQKVNLACMWRQWHASRISLDEELASILSSLSKLPSSEDVPASVVLYIAARASGSRSLINTQSSSTDMLQAAQHWGGKLLGVSPNATAEADKAFQKLLDVHDRDASLLEDFIAAITVPGAVLTPRQHALFCSSCVKSCVALVDLLRLTQTAAMEEKRMMLLRPFVFTNPSVMAVGD
jgi:hypothetical protein